MKAGDTLSDEHLHDMSRGYCPDCGYAGFRLGPHGGAAQNIECMGCHSIFNVTVFGWKVVMAQCIKIVPWVQPS